MATEEIIICNLRDEVTEIVEDIGPSIVDLSAINEAIENLQNELALTKMSAGAIIFPGQLEANESFKVTDQSAAGGVAFYIPAGETLERNYYVKGLPLGAYSIIVRAMYSNLTGTSSSILFYIKGEDSAVTASGVREETVASSNNGTGVTAGNFTNANKYQCISLGYDYQHYDAILVGTWDHDELKIKIKASAPTADIKIDYIHIIPSGTALGSIQ